MIPSWILSLLIAGGGLSTLCFFFTRLCSKERVSQWFTVALMALEKVISAFLIKKYNSKTDEEIEETALGTLYFAFWDAGGKGLKRLKSRDTNNSMKNLDI